MKWLRIVFIFLLVSLCIGLRGITDAKAKSGIRLKKKAKGGGSRGGSKPIKLSGKKKKGAASRGGLASVQGRRKAPPPPSEPTREQIEEMTMQPDEPKAPPPPDTDEAVVSILDPPNKSTIAGSSFDLRVQIDPVNSEVFMESYNNSNSRVCVSLDGSPYSCWPVFGGKIRYINAVDGPHSIHAVLMKKGVIIPESITESVQFTTVESPEIEDENEEESSALEEEGEDGESKRVQLSMPQLILQVPPEKVTLPGSAVQLVSRVDLAGGDIEVFEEHFKHQFVCYNVDATTAHACWSLLDESTVPFVTQLEPGLHTVEGVITHPETRKEISETAFETRTFFSAGDQNEAAVVVVEVEVDAVTHQIPVARGGDANNQGFYFCGSRGITAEECPEFVAAKIFAAAEEVMR